MSPLIPATACKDPLHSEPTVTSIPVDSCVKPPSFHSSPLDKLHRYPAADLLKRKQGDVRRFEALYIVGVL